MLVERGWWITFSAIQTEWTQARRKWRGALQSALASVSVPTRSKSAVKACSVHGTLTRFATARMCLFDLPDTKTNKKDVPVLPSCFDLPPLSAPRGSPRCQQFTPLSPSTLTSSLKSAFSTPAPHHDTFLTYTSRGWPPTLTPSFRLRSGLCRFALLDYITFMNEDSPGDYELSSFRSPARRTRKTVAESLVLAEKNYQKSLGN